MRIPLSWLREFVDIPVSPEQLAERLTLAGLEVASIDYIGTVAPEKSPWAPELDKPVPPDSIPWDAERVLVGELLEVRQHPNADRLTVPLVGYGDGRSVAVVTGAPNVRPGMRGDKVALALNGARLIDGHSDTRRWMTLKPAKLRGVASEGMLCSELELGLSDEHEGILFLPDDAPIGTPLREYLGDVVFDIDLTPNLARALSITGVAREVAAILGVPLRLPDPVLVAEGPPIEGRARVSVESAEDCPRFTLGLVEGVTVGPSPWWMQHRLRMAGMRPIANIVDVSNYVMLEWGQPTHTFDADLVADRHLIVRRARPGETLRTLDGQDRTLGPEHVVVADPSGPEGLAGVMGGVETEVSDATRNVLLEAAIWNTTTVRKTAQHFRLPSEASYRFQRGVDPELPPIAQRRALELIREVAGGSVASGLIDVYGKPWQPLRLELPASEVRRLLGVEIAAPRIAELLEALGFSCEVGAQSVQVEVPSFRLDVTNTADLVEEVARIHGYDNIPPTRIDDELPPPFTDQAQLDERFVRDVLVACGLHEAITYTMTGRTGDRAVRRDGAGYRALCAAGKPDRAGALAAAARAAARAIAGPGGRSARAAAGSAVRDRARVRAATRRGAAGRAAPSGARPGRTVGAAVVAQPVAGADRLLRRQGSAGNPASAAQRRGQQLGAGRGRAPASRTQRSATRAGRPRAGNAGRAAPPDARAAWPEHRPGGGRRN